MMNTDAILRDLEKGKCGIRSIITERQPSDCESIADRFLRGVKALLETVDAQMNGQKK